MKQKINRTKSYLGRLSKSSLAIALALLMVFGTMATSFAVVIEHADLGVNLDVAESGYSKGNVYYSSSRNGTYTLLESVTLSNNGGNFTKSLTASETFYFYIQCDTNNNFWGGNFTLPLNSNYNMAQYYSTSSIVKIAFTATSAGDYKFTFTNLAGSGQITATYTGSSSSTEAPTQASTESGGTTDDTGVTSSKSLLVVYDTGLKRKGVYVWNACDAAHKALTTGLEPDGLYYIDFDQASLSNYSASNPFYFIIKSSSDSNDWSNQSNDMKISGFKKGTQGYFYQTKSNAKSDENAKLYTPLQIEKVTRPTTIYSGESNSFTVSVGGGLPWFFNYKSITSPTKNYTLKVGTSSGGSNVLSSTTCNYATKKFTFNWTPSSSGNITLYYTLSDGIDTVTYSKSYTVTAAETKHAVTISASPSAGGTVTPASGTEVGESTAETITATANAGYDFSGWVFGTGITGASTSANPTTITTKSSGAYTVQANFTKKNLTVSKGTHTNGDFTLSATTAQIGDTITISNITPDKGYMLATSNPVKYTYNGTTSNATKSGSNYTFTMPGYDTTVSVTFANKTGNTITRSISPDGIGTLYVGTLSNTAATSATYLTYSRGDTRYANAPTIAGYNYNKIVVTYADGYTDETTNRYIQIDTTGEHFSSANNGSVNVVAYYTAKPTYAISATTNKAAWGTVSVSPASAYAGQTVTVTVSPDSGSFSSIAATKTGDSSTTVALTTVTEGSSYTFTMPAYAVTVAGTFAEYSGTSNWYYNGYTTNGWMTSSDAGYSSDGYGVQMNEAKANGATFAYHEVQNRSGNNQLFTVSYMNPIHPTGGYDYIYFHGHSGNDSSGWAKEHDMWCWFYSSDEQLIQTGECMEYAGYDGDYKLWRKQVPYGAKYVTFQDHNNSVEWGKIDLSSRWGGGDHEANNMAYYHYGSTSGSYNIAGFDNPVPVGFNEYFYNMGSVYYATSSHSYDRYGVSFGGASHELVNPKDAPTSGSYYVLVLYPGNTYTINGDTVSVPSGNVPYIVYTGELPGNTEGTAKIYAKDGAIRGSSLTYANIADTKIYLADGTTAVSADTATDGQTYETYRAEKGETVVIKTTIKSDYKTRYYVRAFIINGEAPSINSTVDSDGVYTLTYKVPEDFDGANIEITPVYYVTDSYLTANSLKVVTFRVTGKASLPDTWGTTLYAYPFYGTLGGHNNAFGAYPGQPMIYYNGQYQMQIPVKSTAWAYDSDSNNTGGTSNLAGVNNTPVGGVTLSNGYRDTLHQSIESLSAHVQTYDYDDFYKIYNEKNTESSTVDNIVIDMKYRTDNDNKSAVESFTGTSASDFTTTFANGFEPLTNYHGKTVDLFGDLVSGDNLKYNPMYVVSVGGPTTKNIAGNYATEWVIYAPSSPTGSATYSKVQISGGKSSIPPSVLVLNNDTTSFNTTTYPSTVSGYSITDWKALYTALKAYKGYPVQITYEKHKSEGDADRSDARWLYSSTGESITSTIRVDVSTDNGVTYSPNPASGETGHVDGLNAYFTNEEAYQQTTYTTLIDPDEEFDFTASTTNAEYKFVGWYLDDGTKITTENSGSTECSGSYTLVARFKQVTEGQLVLSHIVGSDSTYTGSGATTIAVTVKDGSDNVLRTFDATASDITLGDAYISTEHTDYKIYVTLKAAASGEDIYHHTTSSAAAAFFNGAATQTLTNNTDYGFYFTVGSLFNNNNTQSVKSIIYKSYFTQVKYAYNLTFTYKDRNNTDKSFNRQGALSVAEAANTNYLVVSGATHTLKAAFINKIAPYESNFNQTLKWNASDLTSSYNSSTNTYTWTATVTSSVDTTSANVRSTTRTATFKLPYAHDVSNGEATLSGSVVSEAEVSDFTVSDIEYGNSPMVTVDGEETFVTAPKTIDNSGTTKYFQYWLITNNSGVEIGKCFFNSFNFILYDNYIITPVYAVDAIEDTTSASVAYLETSRNQWNGTGVDAASSAKTDGVYNAADLLYNDFVLSYHYAGHEISNEAASLSNVEVGYVVDRIQRLATKADGTPYTDPSYYAGTLTAKTATVQTLAEGSDTTAESGKMKKYTIDKTKLDNKDRVEFYQAYYSSTGWDAANQTPAQDYTYENYVYAVYTYIKVDGVAYVSSVPAYFTMYAEATK